MWCSIFIVALLQWPNLSQIVAIKFLSLLRDESSAVSYRCGWLHRADSHQIFIYSMQSFIWDNGEMHYGPTYCVLDSNSSFVNYTWDDTLNLSLVMTRFGWAVAGAMCKWVVSEGRFRVGWSLKVSVFVGRETLTNRFECSSSDKR